MSGTGTRVNRQQTSGPDVGRAEIPQGSNEDHVSKGKLYDQIRAGSPGAGATPQGTGATLSNPHAARERMHRPSDERQRK